MEKYREEMIREIEVRGLATSTQQAYLRSMGKLVDFYKKDPEQITFEEIKKFLHHLQNENATGRNNKRAPSSVNGASTAIMFFYKNVLKKNYYGELPRMKGRKIAPTILSRDEVNNMISGVHNVLWKAVLMVTYSGGLRQSEVRNLKVSDIDTQRMVLYIRNSKGAKDRQAILYPNVLDCLRTYWKQCRIDRNQEVKSDYLFIPNKHTYNGEIKKKLSHTAIDHMVKRAAEIAGVKKKSILIA